MLHGFVGAILRIDLTQETVNKQQLDPILARKFLGGVGLAAKILFDELPAKIEPLGPLNKLIFATGPATGCPFPGANRFVIVTKSPETGFFLDTYAGGHFAPELKFAGYDILIIEGRAEKPVYVQIDNDEINIKDASQIWGKDCWEAETILKKKCGRNSRVAVIGPAGEKLVKFAVVSTDYYHQCGRGGVGAVMGSKNLKGLVVTGTKGISIFDSEKLLDYLATKIEWKYARGPDSQNVGERIKYGTPMTLDITQSLGVLPTRNFSSGQFDSYDQIDGYSVRENLVTRDKACYSCSTPCCKLSLVKCGQYAGARVGGPEYETIAMLGSNLGIGDISAIVQENALCDQLGVDTISTGNIIGFAMECYEKGMLTSEDTGGLELRFGNAEAALELISKIAYREGIGNILADGVKIASKRIGKCSEKFAMHVKGMEYPAYEPRGSPAYALLYAVTPRGACHRRAWPLLVEAKTLKPFVTTGRAKLAKDLYIERIPLHCGLVCDFTYAIGGINLEDFAVMLSSVTGWDFTVDELHELSERVVSLVRSFNVREGAMRKDDILATRTLKEFLSAAPENRGPITKKMLDKMLDEYYGLMGWNRQNGIPTPATLKKLGLQDVLNKLSCSITIHPSKKRGSKTD